MTTQDVINAFLREGMETVVFDFDGTICPNNNDYGKLPPPTDKLYNQIWMEKMLGNKIVVCSARINERWENDIDQEAQVIRDYMAQHGLPCDEVWTGRGKPLACRYYDDCAVEWENAGPDYDYILPTISAASEQEELGYYQMTPLSPPTPPDANELRKIA